VSTEKATGTRDDKASWLRTGVRDSHSLNQSLNPAATASV
jgi:hypothetical protein